jgi:acetyltransferase-like isoleucine patch superfamily enzyme
LDGVAIADGCVIAAGCVVTRSTEPLGIYLGNPARLTRYRGDRRGE